MDTNVRALDSLRLERERRSEPELEESGGSKPAHRLVMLSGEQRERERILPPGAVAEATGGAYKMLRTQVLRRLKQLNANSLAVFSAGKGEGKTLSAINLAIAIAADPAHTALLVDLDLRNPSIQRRFGFQAELGIEDCLESRRPISEAMVKVAGYERLTLLPARARVEMSSELLGTQRVTELVEELRSRYVNRVVIFDLPPVLMADDALVFSRQVQAALFVVAEGKTSRQDLLRSLELTQSVPIVGTVLNRSLAETGVYY
jgi:protein-tyrosine kinase